jgi:hypothetical protein
MAVTRTIVMKHSARSRVLVLGEHPINKEPFEQRRLTPTSIKLDQLDDNALTNSARGVLLSPFPGKFALISEYFEQRLHRACELGLMTAVYVPEKKVQVSEIRNAIYARFKLFEDIVEPEERKRRFDSLFWVYLGETDWNIAETFARYDPGPPLGAPVIDQSSVVGSLDRETETLLKRAFHDCDRITVRRLAGGRTAKETLCVFANRPDAEFGPQPMPFFVKFGDAEKINNEMRNYREFAEPFIPFHLRPSLDESRSVKTLNAAALVCNFVEGAVSLRHALRAGQGDGVIFSFFEVTLRGLRSHTLNGPKKSGVIEAFFDPKEGRVKAHEIEKKHPSRIEQLRDYGITRKPDKVEDVLRKCGASINTCEGLYHGDPHAGNIMVRNRDAIVIDFGSMGLSGPLSADPAILEVSLIFGTDDDDDPKSFNVWRKFVTYIFEDPLSPPLPRGDYPQFTWLHKAVRELRHVVTCCGVEDPEALIILAGCLLRFGRFPPLKLASKRLNALAERRRAYALVVADQICTKVEELYAAR